MGILKKGSFGESVKILQRYLEIKADGDFGNKTEIAVMRFQTENSLIADGIVGNKTWRILGIASTDSSETSYKTENGLWIKPNYLDQDEYVNKVTQKDFLFLHHTSGWNNPYNTIHDWNTDNRGAIGTEFIIGGQSVKNNDNRYDGEVLQAIPEGYYAWHLGKIGKRFVHTNSVGIELCNFGQIKNGKTWAGTKAHPNQVVKLNQEFRGFKEFHRYSDEQLNNLKELIKYIAKRDNIDVTDGLPKLIKKIGVKAFDFQNAAYNGTKKGLWTHVNTRKDKLDCFPQSELIDVLTSL